MARPPGCSAWTARVATHLPHRRGPQARVWALWRSGLVRPRACGRLPVATWLALVRRQLVEAVAPRLSAGCGAAPHKAGGPRQSRAGTAWCGPLGRWGVALGRGPPRALAREAPAGGVRGGVWPVRVVYGGGALPVAWPGLPAHQPHAWRRARRRRQGRPAMLAAWTGLGLAARAAEQPGYHGPPGRPGALVRAARVGGPRRPAWVRARDRLGRAHAPPGVYAARRVGGGRPRGGVSADRPAARGLCGRLGWVAGRG